MPRQVQYLSTDGFGSYPKAVAKHFGKDVDYAVIIKNYMPPPTTPEAKRRYSPNKVIGTTVAVVERTGAAKIGSEKSPAVPVVAVAQTAATSRAVRRPPPLRGRGLQRPGRRDRGHRADDQGRQRRQGG